MNQKVLLTEPEAGALRQQIQTCSIVLLSVEKTSIPYEDGDHYSDGAKVTFGVASTMEEDFVIVQTVPLPSKAFPLDGNTNEIVEVAKVALKQRLRKLADQLVTPSVSWL